MHAMFPIRCTLCQGVIQHLYPEYLRLIAEGVKDADALNQLGFTDGGRVCCRRMFTTYAERIEKELYAAEIRPERPMVWT